MLTPEEAVTGLGAVVGGGGLASILVAWMGYLTEARKGRRPSDGSVSIAITDGYAQGKWAEINASHFATIAYAATRLVALAEIEAERVNPDHGFHDRLETKITLMLARAILPGVPRA